MAKDDTTDDTAAPTTPAVPDNASLTVEHPLERTPATDTATDTDDKSTETTDAPAADAPDADAADKADEAPAAEEEAPEKDLTGMPEGGQGKFWDPEAQAYDWAAHAKDAEYRLTQATGDGTALEKVGLSMEELDKTLNEHGNLSDAQYEALAKLGLPEKVVETYVKGLGMLGESYRADMADWVGGQERLDAILTWAVDGIDEEDGTKERINAQLKDPNTYREALDVLQVRYVTAQQQADAAPSTAPPEKTIVPTTPGGPAPAGDTAPFTSVEELSEAQRNPLYRANTTEGARYRQGVEDRARRGNFKP